MERNINNLSKYLVTKGIDSPLKIQKILFFLRYEELLSNQKNESFFNEKNNFQAWIYGPVNLESFKFLENYFNKSCEKETFILKSEDIKVIDKIYGKWLEKYINFSGPSLVSKSHMNLAWQRARGDLGVDELCKKYLDENDDFLKFENEN